MYYIRGICSSIFAEYSLACKLTFRWQSPVLNVFYVLFGFCRRLHRTIMAYMYKYTPLSHKFIYKLNNNMYLV